MRTILLAAGLIAAALPALASPSCTAPAADRRPIADLTAKLSADGWTVANVKTEHGCYEVYAKTADGKRVEVFFDPVTFEEVGRDD